MSLRTPPCSPPRPMPHGQADRCNVIPEGSQVRPTFGESRVRHFLSRRTPAPSLSRPPTLPSPARRGTEWDGSRVDERRRHGRAGAPRRRPYFRLFGVHMWAFRRAGRRPVSLACRRRVDMGDAERRRHVGDGANDRKRIALLASPALSTPGGLCTISR